jgi:hypothetical protein
MELAVTLRLITEFVGKPNRRSKQVTNGQYLQANRAERQGPGMCDAAQEVRVGVLLVKPTV